MKITPTRFLSTALLCSALALIPACGGGGGGGGAAAGSGENGPTLLFPKGVDSGQLAMTGLTLELSDYAGTAVPAHYKATITLPSGSSCVDYGAFAQDQDSRAGRLVFFLESDESKDNSNKSPYLKGRLVVTISPSAMNDAALSRTGSVESTSEVFLFTPSGDTNTAQELNIIGSPVAITWGSQGQEGGEGAPEKGE